MSDLVGGHACSECALSGRCRGRAWGDCHRGMLIWSDGQNPCRGQCPSSPDLLNGKLRLALEGEPARGRLVVKARQVRYVDNIYLCAAGPSIGWCRPSKRTFALGQASARCKSARSRTNEDLTPRSVRSSHRAGPSNLARPLARGETCESALTVKTIFDRRHRSAGVCCSPAAVCDGARSSASLALLRPVRMRFV
jgi:hypothetical protein